MWYTCANIRAFTYAINNTLLRHTRATLPQFQRTFHFHIFLAILHNSDIDNIAAIGYLDYVKWMHAINPDKITYAAAYWAAQCGALGIVKWFHSCTKYGKHAHVAEIDFAAANGHLHIIKWLTKHTTPVAFRLSNTGATTFAMDWAAKGGYLEVMKWLYANRTEGYTSIAMTFAVNNGRFNVAQWLYSIGCRLSEEGGYTSKPMTFAVNNGHFGIAHWLYNIGCRLSEKCLNSQNCPSFT